jgi:hypothetical protein
MHRFLAAAYLTVSLASAADLEVTVYNLTGMRPGTMEDAGDALLRILRVGGFQLHWTEGHPDAPEAHSAEYYLGASSREQENDLRCRARRSLAIRIVPPPRGLHDSALGQSSPFARTGTNITVFGSRIEAAAREFNVSPGILFGYVMAHEIGHVLSRSPRHSRHGLMAAVWGRPEYQFIARRVLFFTSEDLKAMHRNLAGTGCEADFANSPIAVHKNLSPSSTGDYALSSPSKLAPLCDNQPQLANLPVQEDHDHVNARSDTRESYECSPVDRTPH